MLRTTKVNLSTFRQFRRAGIAQSVQWPGYGLGSPTFPFREEGEIFSQRRSNWLWSRPSLPFYGYWGFFLGVKAAEAWGQPLTFI